MFCPGFSQLLSVGQLGRDCTLPCWSIYILLLGAGKLNNCELWVAIVRLICDMGIKWPTFLLTIHVFRIFCLRGNFETKYKYIPILNVNFSTRFASKFGWCDVWLVNRVLCIAWILAISFTKLLLWFLNLQRNLQCSLFHWWRI